MVRSVAVSMAMMMIVVPILLIDYANAGTLIDQRLLLVLGGPLVPGIVR